MLNPESGRSLPKRKEDPLGKSIPHQWTPLIPTKHLCKPSHHAPSHLPNRCNGNLQQFINPQPLCWHSLLFATNLLRLEEVLTYPSSSLPPALALGARIDPSLTLFVSARLPPSSFSQMTLGVKKFFERKIERGRCRLPCCFSGNVFW